MKNLHIVLLSMTLGAGSSAAQEASPFTFSAGAGFTRTLGNTRKNLDTSGWNVRGGVGLKKVPRFNRALPGVGLNLDLGYDQFGVRSSVINSVGATGSDYQVFTAMVNPIIHLSPIRHVNAYITGGGGLFHQSQNFYNASLSSTTPYNPFLGIYPQSTGATQVNSYYSVNKPGWDAGVGLEFGTRFHGKVFAEARYYHMFNNNSHTDFIPVTFGFRW